MIQASLTYVPTPILCIVCDGYIREGHGLYKLTAFPGEPLMHWPQCFDEWLAAARDEFIEQQNLPDK